MRISTVKPVSWLAVNRHFRHNKLRNIAFIIEGDSSAITNAIYPSLAVNYGSVYLLPLHMKTGDGD